MTQIVVLAGGLGTRSMSATPKLLTEIVDKPLILNYIKHFNEMSESDRDFEVLFLLGNGSKQIKEYIENQVNQNCISFAFNIIEETTPLGVLGSIVNAAEYLQDEIILLMGDLYFEFDFIHFLHFSRSREAKLAVVVHPNGHTFDSDVANVDYLDCRLMGINSKETREKPPTSNLALAGIFYLKDFVERLKGSKANSLTSFLEYLSVNEKRCFVYVSAEFIKDIGVPSRRFEVERLVQASSPLMRSRKTFMPAIFIDRDDTLVEDGDESSILSVELVEAIKMNNELGIRIFVVTNQPSIAKGITRIEHLFESINNLNLVLDQSCAFIDDWYICPHHPERGFSEENRWFKVECWCRKPKIGLIEFAAKDHNVDLSKSIMIGDSEIDFRLSDNAKIEFVHTRQFKGCSIESQHVCFGSTGEALKYALSKLC